MKDADYSLITERPGSGVTQEQILRAYQRYHFASLHSQGRDLLEVACGGGIGLSLLAESARTVTAIDLDTKNLAQTREIHRGDNRIRIAEGDAQQLPFPDHNFDVVILFEAIYYLPEPERFLADCRRVLRPGGKIIIGSANREWRDFNPSLYSVRYYSTSELQGLLRKNGFATEMYRGFPVGANGGPVHAALSWIKRTAVKLHLIPKSMRYKKFLKRIFVGRLVPLPGKLAPGSADYLPPVPIEPSDTDRQFKVIYAVATLKPVTS